MKVEDLKGQQVLMAVSGGLDSCTITHWLVAQGVGVVAYTADLGQPDEKTSPTSAIECWPAELPR